MGDYFGLVGLVFEAFFFDFFEDLFVGGGAGGEEVLGPEGVEVGGLGDGEGVEGERFFEFAALKVEAAGEGEEVRGIGESLTTFEEEGGGVFLFSGAEVGDGKEAEILEIVGLNFVGFFEVEGGIGFFPLLEGDDAGGAVDGTGFAEDDGIAGSEGEAFFDSFDGAIDIAFAKEDAGVEGIGESTLLVEDFVLLGL